MFQEEGALPAPAAAQPNPSPDLGAQTVGGDELWHIPLTPLPRRASQVPAPLCLKGTSPQPLPNLVPKCTATARARVVALGRAN